jgi:regulator of sirC expression with transglutaminase-like and TPR domain
MAGEPRLSLLNLNIPTALDYFGTLVQSDEGLPLLEAVASLAQDEYPELDVAQVLGDVDQLQARLKRKLASDASELQKLMVLHRFFYQELGFAANANNYYDPDNSFLHVVLRTRRGIPVSLAVLWMELAQSLDLHVAGVSFPGHFMVRISLAQGDAVIDPLTGQSLSAQDLQERLANMLGTPAQNLEIPLGLYLQPCPPRDVVARMLRNLQEIHANGQDWQRLVAVLDRLIVTLPELPEPLRDRGRAHMQLKNWEQAHVDFANYLSLSPEAPDREKVETEILWLQTQR